MNMNDPKDAPKDGTVIIVDAGYSFLLQAIWNEPSKEWCCAISHNDLYLGKWDDTYFENEHVKEIHGWLPFPTKEQL